MVKGKQHILFPPALSGAEIDSVNNCLNRYLKSIIKEIHDLPNGQLYVRYRNNTPNFCNYSDNRIKGITRRPDLVHKLARRRFLLLQVPLLKQILHSGWTPEVKTSVKHINAEINEMLSEFESAGLLIGREVFLSFEHDTKDVKLIMKIVIQMLISNPGDNRYLIYAAQNAGCNVKEPSPIRSTGLR